MTPSSAIQATRRRIWAILFLLGMTILSLIIPRSEGVAFILRIDARVTSIALGFVAYQIHKLGKQGALDLPTTFALASLATNILLAFNAIKMVAVHAADDISALYFLFICGIAAAALGITAFRWEQYRSGSYRRRFERLYLNDAAALDHRAMQQALGEWSADFQDPCRADFVRGWNDCRRNRPLNPPTEIDAKCAYHSGFIAARDTSPIRR